MYTSLSNLVDKLSGVYDKECKNTMERKKIWLNCKFIGFKNGRLNYRCKECKKSYTKLANESIKNFPTLYKFCNGDINKFFLLLRKGIYPYEYIDSWKRFDENTVPPKEAFYSKLNLENIIDKDYKDYTDTDNFIIDIITEDLFEDISNDVEVWFDTFNYDENDKIPRPIDKNKKVIGLFKEELGGRIMNESCALKAKTYSYLMDDNSEVKKSKGTRKCVINRRLMFENYRDSLFSNKTILKSQQRFKSDHHKVYTEEVNQIALSSIMIKEYKHLIRLKHTHVEQMRLKYVKVK